MNYLLRKGCEIAIKRPDSSYFKLSAEIIKETIEGFDIVIKRLQEVEVDIFGILGMRNLSAFVGELFAASLIRECGKQFVKNPHQDGYPDLLLMDQFGESTWKALALRLREKQPFSPFPTGGIEIKATVGSVKTPAQLARQGLQKPDIGDQRISFILGYDWKAHHRDTNNLIGIYWDFIAGAPCIASVFYSNALTAADWGAIIQPREGGGRTTSVSIMTRVGVELMYQGWLVVLDDDRYINFLNRRNRGNLINRALATTFNTDLKRSSKKPG
jgi:hypothetical protein